MAAALSACTNGSSEPARSAAANGEPLTMFAARTPPLRVPHYETRGTYPQFRRAGTGLNAVNRTIRDALRVAQRDYAAFARKARARMPELFRPSYPHPGVYETTPKARLTSASTVVVSTLVPVIALLPGGNDGSTWISVTVQVPSGSRVTIAELFADRTQGLRVLAREVLRRVVSANRCIRRSVRDPVVGRLNIRGFEPRATNYRHFALTESGLVVGFPLGQVGGSSCGRVEAVVPYDVVRPHLSALGRKLVAGVRRPRA